MTIQNFLFIVILLTLIDILTTDIAISKGFVELNPVQRFFMNKLSDYWWIPKLLITIALVIALKYIHINLIYIVIVVLVVAVIKNIINIMRV